MRLAHPDATSDEAWYMAEKWTRRSHASLVGEWHQG